MKLNICFITVLFLFVSSSLYAQNSQMYNYRLEGKGDGIMKLSGQLYEISGLTAAKDDRVFAHNDEESYIFELDIKTGKIKKYFYAGDNPVSGDFEDIAYTNGKFFLLTSDGTLLEFREGGSRQGSYVKKIETGLKSSNDVEGLEYDAATNSLLLACKGKAGKGMKNKKAVYSFSLKSYNLNEKPRFLLDEKYITGQLGIRSFSPSAIKKHPVSGTYFILSANDNAIVELNSEGRILAMMKLSKKLHPQPESLCFLSDNTLLIGDESGILTRYRYRRK